MTGQRGDRLAEVLREVRRWEWPLEVLDAEWRLVYVSPELCELLGTSEEGMGYGESHLDRLLLPAWRRAIAEVDRRSLRDEAGTALAEGLELPEPIARYIGEVEPVPTRELRSYFFKYHAPYVVGDEHGRPPLGVTRAAAVLRDPGGERIGEIAFYLPRIPVTFVDLAGRGDAAMLRRLAALASPRRRSAGILFADLERSASLSRRLPTAAYFELGRQVAGSVDSLVVAEGGVVGQHTGDGLTAFFLAEQLESEAAAACALLRVAKSIPAAVAASGRRLAERGAPLEPDGLRVRVSAHWGGQLYVGQVSTPGRFEVTALGDEVNEAARIEQSAAPGQVLASKEAIERLDPGDAAVLGIDPQAVAYVALSDLPGASQKAIADAGTISVTPLAPAQAPPAGTPAAEPPPQDG